MAGKNPAQIMLLSTKILPNLEDFATLKIPNFARYFSPNWTEKGLPAVSGKGNIFS